MSLPVDFIPSVPLAALKVWVLAPYLVTQDDTIDYYYDFSQSIAEYEKTFQQLGLAWQWQPVTLEDYPIIIDKILII